MIGKVAAAEAQHADALLAVEGAQGETAAAKKAVASANKAKDNAESRAKVMEGAADDLRQILVDNGIPVPKHLSKKALSAAGQREAFAAAHGAAAERMLDAAVANSDSARIALRVAALQEKGIDPPVDGTPRLALTTSRERVLMRAHGRRRADAQAQARAQSP